MRALRTRARAVLAAALAAGGLLACSGAAVQAPYPAPEFTHREPADWLNSAPLELAKLRGKVVLVEFWAFECVNCLNTRAWVESEARTKAGAGLVVIGVHTPELRDERSPDNVRAAVARLGIHYPVMIDGDYSYWNALGNQYWPAFYLIGRDGLVHGRAVGELHVGDGSAHRVETLIDQLLAAAQP
ncbi:MAG TPA: redoxin family protein [Steroidobacteraceae bacterium]|nr:redoxin family protein [Steroidobacteraceae bacterium]